MFVEPLEVFTLYPLNLPASLFLLEGYAAHSRSTRTSTRGSLLSKFQYFPVEVVAQPEVTSVTEQPPSVFPDADDSHLDCSQDHHHLRKTASIYQLCAKVSARVWLVGAVTNYCDPDTYPTQEEVVAYTDRECRSALGCIKIQEKWNDGVFLSCHFSHTMS